MARYPIDGLRNQPDQIIIPVGDFQESPAPEAAVIVRGARDEAGTGSNLVIPGGEAGLIKTWGCAGSVSSRFRRSGPDRKIRNTSWAAPIPDINRPWSCTTLRPHPRPGCASVSLRSGRTPTGATQWDRSWPIPRWGLRTMDSRGASVRRLSDRLMPLEFRALISAQRIQEGLCSFLAQFVCYN